MRTAAESRPAPASAAELIAQAGQYERFAEIAGDVLAPEYRRLAADLCRRAAALMDPGAPAHPCPAQRAASIKPRGPQEVGEAWKTFLALVAARRGALSDDGAELLGEQDPGPVLWAAVAAVVFILNQVTDATAQTLLSRWGVSAARLAEGVSSHG